MTILKSLIDWYICLFFFFFFFYKFEDIKSEMTSIQLQSEHTSNFYSSSGTCAVKWVCDKLDDTLYMMYNILL